METTGLNHTVQDEQFDSNVEIMAEDIPTVDYSQLSKAELIATLESLVETDEVTTVKDDVEAIKIAFYKKHKIEVDAKRKAFITEGGNSEEFVSDSDGLEIRLKELLNNYRSKRSEAAKELDIELNNNYQRKLEIIEKLKVLINSDEAIGDTFASFKDLQSKWKEVGNVPKSSVNDVWETYHHCTEQFYDFVKINNELRDLDLKKNFEAKTIICEKAEALVIEPSVLVAFRTLQSLHEQWREVGPVAQNVKEQLWERFKAASTIINKRHQEYFEKIKDEQVANLNMKSELCEKVDAVVASELTNKQQWEEATEKIIELQKLWKTIGFAPKKDNNSIYERFREACNLFFEKKQEFFTQLKEGNNESLQAKKAICIQAEALKDSTEWQKTSNELIRLQGEWKKLGHTAKREGDILWKRFRTACDTFFEAKNAHHSTIDLEYGENLRQKESIIGELKNFASDNASEALNILKDIQRRWSLIGFTPIKDKDRVQKEYKDLINNLFASFKHQQSDVKLERFKEKVTNIKDGARHGVSQEREKLQHKLKQLETDITLWENNIGFFSRSKNAQSLIKDVENKIEKAKEEVKLIKDKIKIINS